MQLQNILKNTHFDIFKLGTFTRAFMCPQLFLSFSKAE